MNVNVESYLPILLSNVVIPSSMSNVPVMYGVHLLMSLV